MLSGLSRLLSPSAPLPGVETWAEPGRAVWLRDRLIGETVQVGRFDASLPGRENRMRPLQEGFRESGVRMLRRCMEEKSGWAVIDEIGYLPMDIQGANLFFQLITRRYEKVSTIFTSNKTFSQWNEVFADVTIASAILDRVLHHCTVINIKGESYRLKERKEFMRQKQRIVNTLFEQGN